MKNVFLHGDLKEVYMDVPPSFESYKTKGKCVGSGSRYIVLTNLLGLGSIVHHAILRYNFEQNQVDYTL